MALSFAIHPQENVFVNDIPERMSESPWFYNDTLAEGIPVSLP